MKHDSIITAIVLAIAVVNPSTASDVDFKLQWYHDGACQNFKGEFDYKSGGIFGSGDTPENCKNVGLGLNTGSANVIGLDIQADCSLFAGPNCSGQVLAHMHEGTFGHTGTSACFFLAAPVQSFNCQEG